MRLKDLKKVIPTLPIWAIFSGVFYLVATIKIKCSHNIELPVCEPAAWAIYTSHVLGALALVLLILPALFAWNWFLVKVKW